jgi:hypothetical protein
MGKGKAPKEIRARRNQKNHHRPPSRQPLRYLVSLGRWILGVIGLLSGIAASAFYFLPTVSVAQTEPLNPRNVLSVPFVVTNTAPYALSSVASVCETNLLVAPNGVTLGNNVGPRSRLGPLEAGDRGVFFCDVGPEGFGAPIKADIAIVVTFKPWWWVLKPRSRYFRFKSELTANGMLRWVEMPYRENPYHF